MRCRHLSKMPTITDSERCQLYYINGQIDLSGVLIVHAPHVPTNAALQLRELLCELFNWLQHRKVPCTLFLQGQFYTAFVQTSFAGLTEFSRGTNDVFFHLRTCLNIHCLRLEGKRKKKGLPSVALVSSAN